MGGGCILYITALALATVSGQWSFVSNCLNSNLHNVIMFGEPWGTSRQAYNVVLTIYRMCKVYSEMFEHYNIVCSQVDLVSRRINLQ